MAAINNPLVDAVNNLADEIKRLRRELHVERVFGKEEAENPDRFAKVFVAKINDFVKRNG